MQRLEKSQQHNAYMVSSGFTLLSSPKSKDDLSVIDFLRKLIVTFKLQTHNPRKDTQKQ